MFDYFNLSLKGKCNFWCGGQERSRRWKKWQLTESHQQENKLLSFQKLALLFQFLISYTDILLFGYWPHLSLSFFLRKFNSYNIYSTLSRLINRLISNEMFYEMEFLHCLWKKVLLTIFIKKENVYNKFSSQIASNLYIFYTYSFSFISCIITVGKCLTNMGSYTTIII